jgi:hypothetical protein
VKPPKLSATMRDALKTFIAHGGKLVRLRGGFWTYPDAPITSRAGIGVPEWYAGTTTVIGLRMRGLVTLSFDERRGLSLDGEVTVAGRAALVEERVDGGAYDIEKDLGVK